jgi:hypothetical protein
MLKRMLSRYAVAIWSLATFLCLQAPAQSTGTTPAPAQSAPAQNSAQSQPSAPAQTQQSTAPLQFQDLPPDPHTPTAAELEQQRQQRMLAAAAQLAGAQARWGPEISTPGLSISLVEVGRTKTPAGATEINYQITGSGFAPHEKLILVRWPLDSSAEDVMSGLSLDGKGVAVCSAPAPASAQPAAQAAAPAPGSAADSGSTAQKAPAAPACTTSVQPDQPIQIQTAVASGEAVRVALLGEDRKHGAATSVVPFPMANEDKGCSLQVLLGVKNADLVLVEGAGFPANTSLKLETVTAGQSREINTKTNAEGHLVVAVLPAQKGMDTGDTTVRYVGVNHQPTLNSSTAAAPADPACAPTVTFHWGKGSYKPQ